MIELYLIRHAESVLNTEGNILGGRTNHIPLTEKGRQQAYKLGRYHKERRITFDGVYASPAVRTRSTAEVECSVIGFPLDQIIIADEIQELSQGLWEGLERKKVHTPELLYKINKDPEVNWNFTPPDGESAKMVEERMYAWVEKNILTSDKQSVAVFSHGNAIKCVLRKMLDYSPLTTFKIQIDNTSVTKLKYDHRGWHLLSLNDTTHLYKD